MPYTTSQLEKQVSTMKRLLIERSYSPLSLLESSFNKIKTYKLMFSKLGLIKKEIRKQHASKRLKKSKNRKALLYT
jgi:hypothetical protein